jgi:hypothetical protein
MTTPIPRHALMGSYGAVGYVCNDADVVEVERELAEVRKALDETDEENMQFCHKIVELAKERDALAAEVARLRDELRRNDAK